MSGYGGFTEREIRADSFVYEYGGQRLTGEEGSERMVNGNLLMPIFCFSSIIRTKRLGKDRNLLQTFLVHLFVKLQSLSKTRVFSEHWVVL